MKTSKNKETTSSESATSYLHDLRETSTMPSISMEMQEVSSKGKIKRSNSSVHKYKKVKIEESPQHKTTHESQRNRIIKLAFKEVHHMIKQALSKH